MAVEQGFKAALITVDQPVDYPKFVRKIVTAEIAKKFPGVLYAHCHLDGLEIDHFERLKNIEEGVANFEFMVILDPDYVHPIDNKILTVWAYTLCKTSL